MRIIPVFIFLLFIVSIEVYSFFGLKTSLFSEGRKVFMLVNGGTILLTIIGIFMLINAGSKGYASMRIHENLLFGLAFSFILAKFFISTIFLVEDLFRGFLWIFQSAVNFKLVEITSHSFLAGLISLIIGGSTILLINYGVVFGRYQFKTHHQVLEYENLPPAFEGFKIAQISDLHLGTFDQLNRVNRGLKKLQSQQPDVILFTGDMINNRAEEALPFIDMMKELQAPYGKYSILGNHDYGEYIRWASKNEKEENLNRLKQIEQQMGFQLLTNQHVVLRKDNDSIYLAGVENWGTPPFPQYGDLGKALNGLSSNDFIVLMSHDPTHWRKKVISSPTRVELTLSGHTHGMQFGIEIGKFKWSPVKYRYSDWAGLFSKNGINLYVNRGFGSIGYPGRVGIWPEITIIEFKSKKTQK